MSCKNCTCADQKDILTMPYEDDQINLVPRELRVKSYIDSIGKEVTLGPKKRKILSVKVTETHIHIEFEPLKV